MTSLNGNIFRLTGPLCGESTVGNPPVTVGFPSQRASNAGFDVFFDVSLNKRLHKQLSAGDLRRHDGHCDVTVMEWDGIRIATPSIASCPVAGLALYSRLHTRMPLSTHPLDKMAAISQNFRCILVNEKFCILVKISLKFGPNRKRLIDNNPALV